MDIRPGISHETKQALSQVQMESLSILSMSVTELQEFLQNEEIENPLIEYSAGSSGNDVPVTWREQERFYNGGVREDGGEGELYRIEDGSLSVEELITSQLPLKSMAEEERRVVDFCIQSLEQSGYLLIPAPEIAGAAGVSAELAEKVLKRLKTLEPRGIFAGGLEECLLLQIEGMEQEEKLAAMIKDHLPHVAEGKISNISRALKLSSAEVRKLIQVLKGLNPRPLNGYGGEQAQYIFPDILLSFQDGQWTVEMNDKWTGNVRISEFYIHMMETARDEELKEYFEEKLRRARFIMNAVEQRRKTLVGITEGILKRQAGYLLGQERLKPMRLEEIAAELGVHPSTISRAIRDKYLLAPAGCMRIRELFTAGVSGSSGAGADVSRNVVKEELRALVDGEDKAHPCSDEQLAALLEKKGMTVSRRTVAKYRTELGIGSAFSRREEI